MSPGYNRSGTIVFDAASTIEPRTNTPNVCENVTLPANASDEEARKVFHDKGLVEPLLELSKCPDFVVNRGHYFGTEEFNKTEGLSDDEKFFGKEAALSDEDKTALIEFLKTF